MREKSLADLGGKPKTMNESPQSKPAQEDAIITIPNHPCCAYKKCPSPNKEGGLTLNQQEELIWEGLDKGERMHLECYIRHVLGRALKETLSEHFHNDG